MVVVAAHAVSLLALTLHALLDSNHLGLEAAYWHRVRRRWLPGLHRLAQRLDVGYAAYELDEREFAGRIDQPVEAVETLLADHDFERMPLSAWKTLADGRSEAGSWALREEPLADRQLHVMLFRTGDGATELYAHEEYNPLHPVHASKHYHCIGHDPQAGTERVADLLADHLDTPPAGEPASIDDETSEPPATTRIGTGVELPSAVEGDTTAAVEGETGAAAD